VGAEPIRIERDVDLAAPADHHDPADAFEASSGGG
jgi:hypothetical protein